jgi:hypothetical protein
MNEQPEAIAGRLDQEMDDRKLTFSEQARLSGKEPMTDKAKFILEKKIVKGKPIIMAKDDRVGPVIQDQVLLSGSGTSDLLGGKVASFKFPRAPLMSDLVATKDFEMKSKAIRKMEYSMLGTLTRKDGYNQVSKGILTGNILKKPGLPQTPGL